MKYIALSIKYICDLILILSWFYILINNLKVHWMMIVLSVLYLFFNSISDWVKGE